MKKHEKELPKQAKNHKAISSHRVGSLSCLREQLKQKPVAVIGFNVAILHLLLSAFIGMIQYVTGTRLCELDDILHYTQGGGWGNGVLVGVHLPMT